MTCEWHQVREEPSLFFPFVLRLARENYPLFPEKKCVGCGEPNPTGLEFIKQQRYRNQWLSVGRGHKDHPTSNEMREICEWMIRWGIRPDSFWLHYAALNSHQNKTLDNGDWEQGEYKP